MWAKAESDGQHDRPMQGAVQGGAGGEHEVPSAAVRGAAAGHGAAPGRPAQAARWRPR